MSYDKKLLQLTIVTTHKQTKASLIAHSPKCVVPVSLSAFRENRKHGCTVIIGGVYWPMFSFFTYKNYAVRCAINRTFVNAHCACEQR